MCYRIGKKKGGEFHTKVFVAKSVKKIQNFFSRSPIIYPMQLKFEYVGVRAWGSKLVIGIYHLWSWARFMATQILAINFPNRASWQKLWPTF